ncbi:PCC domain-containing protein [Fimbriimonas ginsengisoli]|uniref:PPC domain-containing protein n=1 Tax=Fimbriimonas ginsengisoli Gsoil 348 TaxID=661478 RepID=A0A068NRA4_FIMGI|nr:DUF296 domain-containing protein [Fimbriimonas ginsengisoli]AIE85971.1 hypothetical protein OP10G_2603 [Fimbriimonas ginsengisoli Gsoil 348]
MEIERSGPGDRTGLVLFAGKELLSAVREHAVRHRISEARLTAQGAFSECVVGWYSFEQKQFVDTQLEGPVAIVTLAGYISQRSGITHVAIHGVFTAPGGNCRAGHLRSGIVRSKLLVSISIDH